MSITDRETPEGCSLTNGRSGAMTVHGESKKHVLRCFDKDGVIYTEPTPGNIYYYVPCAPEQGPIDFEVKIAA